MNYPPTRRVATTYSTEIYGHRGLADMEVFGSALAQVEDVNWRNEAPDTEVRGTQ